jgi:hypothetical protein
MPITPPATKAPVATQAPANTPAAGNTGKPHHAAINPITRLRAALAVVPE